MPRRVFFHVHVRKCGGSTFHEQILKRSFGPSFVRDSSLIEYQYDRGQVAEILSNCPWLKAYSSHKISLDLPYEQPDTELITIAFVRDPIARFLSHYFYLRGHRLDWDTQAKELNLTEYTRQVVESGQLLQQDQHSQLQQLAGCRGSRGLEQVLRYTDQRHVYVWPIERFDEACICLEHLFPQELGNCRYGRRQNQSTPDQSLNDESRSLLRAHLDPAEFELSQIAHQHLDTRLDALFSNRDARDAALSEFRRRCVPRSWWQRLWSW